MKAIQILKQRGQPDKVLVSGGRKQESDELPIEPARRAAKVKEPKFNTTIRISPKFKKLFR